MSPILEFFGRLFDSRFMPHGHCFFWTPDILWMSVIADSLIAISYYIIPLGLVYLVRRRNDLAFSWMFYLFGIFILSCGTTHVMGIVTLWHPLYRLEAVIKVITALASLPTAIALIPLLPRAVALPSHAILKSANDALETEIAERKRIEQEVRLLNAELERRVELRTAELKETTERLEAITEASPLGIWTCDLDGTVTFWNRAAERLYGWQRDEVIGKPLLTVPDEHRLQFLEETEKALPGERVVDLEAKRITKSGKLVDVSFSIAQLPAATGGAAGYLAVMADISERKRAEAALRESELQFRTLADSIPQLAWMADENGSLFWYNRRWYDYTGTTLDDMQGWGWTKVHHAGHVNHVVESISRSFETGDPWEDTFPLRGRDGEWRWFLSRALPIRDSHQKVVRWFGTNTDITEQLNAEAELRRSEARFRQLADAMPQIVWVARADGEYEYYNHRWNEYTGLDTQPGAAEVWQRVSNPTDLSASLERWRHARETGDTYQIEHRLRRHDGEFRWFLTRALPVLDEDGAIQRWYGTSTDIHDQKWIEEELRAANSDLQQFAYAASHDLQEPLRNMSLYSQLLDRRYRDLLDGDAAQFLAYIVDGAQRMTELLRDVLEYSRLTGPAGQKPVEIDCDEAVEECLMNLAAVIADSGASVTFGPLPRLPIAKFHLVQLFQNLLSNAIKYHRPGVPAIVTVSANRGDAGWVFEVRDNGIGIEQPYQTQIFALFKRLHKDQFPGTGIGLAICQKIVERYGGKIWVESELNQGSSFFFSVPDSTQMQPS